MATNELAVREPWLIQSCSMPGCEVTIRVKVGEQLPKPICKWHSENRAYNTKANAPRRTDAGPTMSKEEFGYDLFEAIKTQAGLRQAEQKAELYQRKELTHQAQEAQNTAKGLRHQLEMILAKNTIAPADVRRILAIQ